MNILIKLINDVKALCNTVITAVNAIKAKTDTITADLFTATHASRIDATISSRQASWGATTTHAGRIDASISSRALETTAQAIKAKTDLLSAGALSGNVKSIQRGQLLSASTAGGSGDEQTYRDITISPVNISKCVIFTEIGFSTKNNLAASVAISNVNNYEVLRGLAKLTSPTNLRVHSTFGTSSYFVHGSWTIVEYY